MDLLRLLDTLLLFGTAASALIAFAGVVAMSYLRSRVGLVMILVVLIMGILMPDQPLSRLAGIYIYPTDVVYSCLALAAVLRWLHLAGGGRLPVEYAALAVLAIILLAGFVRGVLEFGPQAAGVEFRRYFYVISGAAYLASFEPTEERIGWSLRAIVATALILCGITLARFATVIGSAEFSRLRVIDSNATLFLAQAMIICLYLWLGAKNPTLFRNLAFVLFPFVLIMQHRTVWVVTIVVLALILLREAKLRNRLLSVLVVGVVFSAVAALLIYGDQGSDVLKESATDSGTFEWRVEGWRVLLEEQAGNLGNLVAGRPLGAGFERYLPNQGYSVDVSPHNYYIELLLVAGVSGLGMLLIVFGGALIRGLRLPRVSERSNSMRLGFALITTQLVYFITYAPFPEQSLILGLTMSMALLPQRRSELEKSRRQTSVGTYDEVTAPVGYHPTITTARVPGQMSWKNG